MWKSPHAIVKGLRTNKRSTPSASASLVGWVDWAGLPAGEWDCWAARAAEALRAAVGAVADRKAVGADRWASGLVPCGTSLVRFERRTMNIRQAADRESMKACSSLAILLHATNLVNSTLRQVTELPWGLSPTFPEPEKSEAL